MKKSIIVIISIILSVCIFFGCYYPRERSQVYHENVEDIERYIVDELGDYIIIDGFDPDVYYEPSSRFNGKIAEWYICFRRSYINDEAKTKTVTPISIIERVRFLYNQYVSSHEDYYLDGSVVEMRFNILDNNTPAYVPYAKTTNWDFENVQPSGRELNSVCLLRPDSNHNYPFAFGEWDYYYVHQDIEIAQMDEDSSMDQIIEVADNMPYLKYIAVKDQDTADEASRLRPDVKFVSVR